MPDSDIIADLTAGGARVEDYFLIGHNICFVNSNGRLMALLVEEGERHSSILDFLRRIGAKVYQSYGDYLQQRSRS